MIHVKVACRRSSRLAMAIAVSVSLAHPALAQRDPSATPAVTNAQGLAPATSERRIALVIGNNAYKGAPLTGPINDARAMANALTGLGFKVVELEDVGRAAMLKAIRQFADDLGDSETIGLFYFAGHGAQSGGRNFLIPIDEDIRGEADIERQSVDIQYMLDKFANMRSGMNILILDACRNNPFAQSESGKGSGLASIDAPPGTLAAFAAAPGHVAMEISNANGIYTKNVLANIGTPGLPVEEVFKRVRTAVLAETDRRQVPWENTSLVRDFYFKGAPAGSGFKPVVADSEGDAWTGVKDSNNLYDYIEFFRRFSTGHYQTEVLQGINAILARLKPAPPLIQASELPLLLSESYAGFLVRPLNNYSADYFGLPSSNGVLVTDVDPGSMAEHAGLLAGDVILKVNGKVTGTMGELLDLSRTILPGEFVNVAVWRNRREVVVSGVLTRAPLERMLTRIGDEKIKLREYDRAHAFFQYLAESGNSLGQGRLGEMYLMGLGVPQDFKTAESWFHKAAVQGLTAPATYLASIYLNPRSGVKDDDGAYHWAKVSAEAGVPEGATELAWVYYKGTGTATNYVEAVRWARIAAAQGEPTAMLMLGSAYESGLAGLPKNLEEAKAWYRRASDLDSAPAKAALRRLGD